MGDIARGVTVLGVVPPAESVSRRSRLRAGRPARALPTPASAAARAVVAFPAVPPPAPSRAAGRGVPVRAERAERGGWAPGTAPPLAGRRAPLASGRLPSWEPAPLSVGPGVQAKRPTGDPGPDAGRGASLPEDESVR